jgi:serine/threonine protein kinase/tetratricopeptide (TPR) repeat protein
MGERSALPHNHLLTLEGRKYRLHGTPIPGGSSLVYKARLEDDITRDFFMIKEFYPYDLVDYIERMPDGNLLFSQDYVGEINIRKERAKRESGIVDKLRHDEENNDPWFLSYSTLIETNNTLYTIIATESGEELSARIDRGYFKSFENACDCVLRILDALEPVHKKGYIHLDISPDNIHFSDMKIARLIDFNSACCVDEPLERLVLSFKEGYSAKELRGCTAKVCPATDLFSVAAVFFEILVGRPQGDDDRLPGIKHVNSADGFLKAASELLVTKTNDFLTKGISHTPRKRFQSVHEMREAIEELRKLKIEIDLVNAPNRVEPNRYYVHRKHELQQIGVVLEQSGNIILEGIGGIGKTELAKAYAWESSYDIIQFINFDRNLRDTIAYNLRFHNFNTLEYEAKFGEDAAKYIFQDKVTRMAKCAESGQRVLLIVDNYSDTSQSDFRLLISGQYHVVFTTRERLGGLEVTPMDEDSSFALFCKYYESSILPPEDEPIIRKIIKTVANHTMTIMLAATAMQRSSVTPSKMLAHLKDGIKNSAKFMIDKEWLINDKREQSMMQHIHTLFDMTQIKTDQIFSRIMVNMAVAPESGIDKKEFSHLAMPNLQGKKEMFVDLDWLIDLRWIHEFYDGDIPHVSLHAVISDVASRELKPTSVKCADFISGLIKTAFGDTQAEASVAINRIKMACKRINDETPLTRDLFFRYAKLSSFIADYASALAYYEKVACLNEKVLGEKNKLTAMACNNVGMMHHKNGDANKALKWYKRAIKSLEQSHDDELHALLFNNIAAIHNANGDYRLALTCYEQALKLYEEMHGHEHPDTAIATNNIACTYLHMKDFDRAKVYFTQAVKLREKVYGKNHRATATTYSNIALACIYQSKYTKALEWEQKALPVRESVMGEEHPETAISYNNLGLIYAGLGDNEKSTGFFQKALAINEKILGKGHPTTVETYRNLRLHEIST